MENKNNKKKKSSIWKIPKYFALFLIGVAIAVPKYKKYKAMNGPYKSDIENYLNHKEAIAKTFFKMQELRESQPTTISEQDSLVAELNKLCNNLPKPTYKFQEDVYKAQLKWCANMFKKDKYLMNAMKQGVPESEYSKKYAEIFREAVKDENFTIDGMDKWYSEVEMAQFLEHNALTRLKR
ncbi:hypothetical protein M902_2338 [Bacteriovorax sp. BAL6_X]|uniref:hypothetical protein n=1 Tax=Bacteriovorax sp. BAL6_X TaxID=1201290 RepID=UPI000385C2C7|nr:hypothetical protein [Bacteriovorax sp. BAL6_X]EPZ52301.1 hypothetical protein M902_2338 [Bacteriovorax sp. BAL6_X]